MSLLDDFAHKCVLMEKKRTPDGAGGYITAWEEGAEFLNYQSLDTSMEARKAEKDGVTYAVQCKCYNAPIGIKAVQEVYAGRDYYDRMVGAVMTNQYFTAAAVEAAGKLKILLWDRGYVESMMEEEE